MGLAAAAAAAQEKAMRSEWPEAAVQK